MHESMDPLQLNREKISYVQEGVHLTLPPHMFSV